LIADATCPTWRLITGLAADHGVPDCAALPAPWVCDLDHEWVLVVNGRPKPQDVRGNWVPAGLCTVLRFGRPVAWVWEGGIRFDPDKGDWEALYDTIVRHREWMTKPA
jgi:hypothetical protein